MKDHHYQQQQQEKQVKEKRHGKLFKITLCVHACDKKLAQLAHKPSLGLGVISKLILIIILTL